MSTPDLKEQNSRQYTSLTSDYFTSNSYYTLNPIKEEIKLNTKNYSDHFTNVLNRCKFVNTRTFFVDLKEVISFVVDPLAPCDYRLVLAEWLYRKIFIFYKPKKNVIGEVCDHLFQPIKDCQNIVLKGLYINYHNVNALRHLAEHFFNNRHPEQFFILQMLNDVHLIQTTPIDKMLTHFLEWIKKTKNYDQQCNLLDVLLRNFPKNEEVKDIHKKMRFGESKGLVNLYKDEQNAHDEDITEETMKAAGLLMEWYKDNAYSCEPGEGEYFEEHSIIDLAIADIQEYGGVTLIDDIVVRAKIDNTLFTGGSGGFTIMKLFVALCRYISLSPSKRDLILRLEEEFKEMNGLCSSGYVNRFINTLQGFDETYSVKIPFKKQLQAAMCYHINLALQLASEEVIAGSYEEEYRQEYLDFLTECANKHLPKMFDQYGKEDVEKSIVVAMEELSGIPDVWRYIAGKISTV
jgi:hypothetical protein